MKILLVNPPNSGRSIPEEKYGITSIKGIFRGEPLSLEVLAGNLLEHEVMILDLKVEPGALEQTLATFSPELVGFTGMTCEANAVLKAAAQVKAYDPHCVVVVGGIHASMDPEYFNVKEIDYIVKGLGKRSFRELVEALTHKKNVDIPGIAHTTPGKSLTFKEKIFTKADLLDEVPPAYGLVERYRHAYTLSALNVDMGFVVTAYGCTFRCSFCCIESQTNGKYLTHSVDAVIRDIGLLDTIPVIRLLDANTFGDIKQASSLCAAIKSSGLKKQYFADIRSDTVVKHPEILAAWKEVGLRTVVIGFEEVTDSGLTAMNKANSVSSNTQAVKILHDLGITIVGDFIISPSYTEADFDRLEKYIDENKIDLPMITVMTPLPGTKLYRQISDQITIKDLDYYTLTNAVMSTKMSESDFYQRYAGLLKKGHHKAKV